MKSDWTRRDFLNTGIAGLVAPALVTSIGAAPRADPAPTLSAAERSTLRLTIDEIIPAGSGMPSASDAGGVSYLEKLIAREPGIGQSIRKCLAALDTQPSDSSQHTFSQVPQAERIARLKALEANSNDSFVLLRDSVYEAYYTQPQIWKLIGYELYPTDHAGPHLKPFDKAVLAAVSQKPRYYREA